MKRLIFHFDVISPFAYLAFERLPQVLQGCSYEVEYRPVLLAGLLQHWGHKGPAEIEPKRAWTFRHVHWLAQQHGVVLDTPAQHPFNPLPLLRLALACADDLRPNRRIVQAVLQHVWVGGANAGGARAAGRAGRATRPAAVAGRPGREAGAAHQHRRSVGAGHLRRAQLHARRPLLLGPGRVADAARRLCAGPWFEGDAWQREGLPRPGIQRG